MTKSTYRVTSQPERRDGRWYFQVWDTATNQGFECITSATFENRNASVPFEIKLHDEVELIVRERMPGTFILDDIRALKPA